MYRSDGIFGYDDLYPLEFGGPDYDPNLQFVIGEDDADVDPTESALFQEQALWLTQRDGNRCQDFYMEENGFFLGFANRWDAGITTLHHIVPQAIYKMGDPNNFERNAHSPLNIITLGLKIHQKIHYIKNGQECADYGEGCKWDDSKDIYYRIIAAVNSRFMLNNSDIEFPFNDDHRDDILTEFEELERINHGSKIETFFQSYLSFRYRFVG